MRGLVLALAVGCLALVAGRARSASLGPPTEELRRIDVGSIDHPGSDGVVLFRGVHVRLEADGRVVRRVRLVQRLMTDHAIAIGGDPRVAYDTTRQELSIQTCRTFMRDGREVNAAPHAFNRVTPERVAYCPDRAGLQEMVISYVGVERGCLTELDYTLTDRVPWQPWLEGVEELGGSYPLRAGELWIETPAGTAAGGMVVGEPLGTLGAEPFSLPMTKPWSYGPIPACPDEGGLPALERVPTIVYTTASLGRLQSFVSERLHEASEPDSAIRAWAGENLPSGRPPIDDAERLQFVAGLVGERTMEAEDAPLSWFLPIRPAGRTFSTSCGNLLDRTALALAAMRVLGIDAKIVLHPIGRSVVEPALCCFDDIRLQSTSGEVSIQRGEAAPWIDPGPATNMLTIDESGNSALRAVGTGGGMSRLALRIVVADDGAVRGEAAIDVRGAIAAGLGVEDLKGTLEGLASHYAVDGKLAGYRVEEVGPLALEAVFSFTGKRIGEALGEGRIAFPIPSAPGLTDAAIPEGVSYTRDFRRTSIMLGPRVEEDVSLSLELAGGGRPIVTPKSGEWAGPGVTLRTSWSREDGRWRYHRWFRVEEGSVSPGDYPAHRAVMIRRLEEDANRVVLASGTAK